MVNIPDSLTWSLISQNNSFMRKRNGRTSRSGAVRFSAESGNLKSLSTFKYSGVANSKTFDVSSVVVGAASRHKIVVTSKTSKAGVSPKKGVATSLVAKNFRTAVGKTLAAPNGEKFYRRDLVEDVKAKYAALYNEVRVKKGIKKGMAVKTGRK